MNKKMLLFIVLIILFIIVLIFLVKIIGKNTTPMENKFKIIKDSTINKENFFNFGPINDDDIDKIPEFTFSVVSEEKNKSKYNVLIEDVVDNDKESLLLNRKYLHYELKLNNKLIKKGKLIDIKNNILDTRVISNNEENKYSLKIWLSINATEIDWENKYYTYNIIVVPAV